MQKYRPRVNWYIRAVARWERRISKWQRLAYRSNFPMACVATETSWAGCLKSLGSQSRKFECTLPQRVDLSDCPKRRLAYQGFWLFWKCFEWVNGWQSQTFAKLAWQSKSVWKTEKIWRGGWNDIWNYGMLPKFFACSDREGQNSHVKWWVGSSSWNFLKCSHAG